MTDESAPCTECGNFPVPPLSPVAERFDAMERVIKTLLRQVQRGGPSNFIEIAGHYLPPDELAVFKEVIDRA